MQKGNSGEEAGMRYWGLSWEEKVVVEMGWKYEVEMVVEATV
jgi:hypothetical protein